MNEFKLLSIDELDAEFVNKLRISKKQASASSDSGVIIELPKDNAQNTVTVDFGNTSENFESTNFSVMDKYFGSDNAPSVYNPQNEENAAPRPIIPLGQNSSLYSPVGASENSDSNKEQKFFSEEDFEEDDSADNKKGSKGAALAGKIISIVMLCVTVIVFLLGCFVSIFLNNNGLEIGGLCFNSQVREITVGDDTIKEGDLIISKKVDINEYSQNLNKPLAVPVEDDNVEGCDIMFIHTSEPLSEDEVSISTYDPITSEIRSENYVSEECFGIVLYYIPFVGGLLSFAINNAVLVCALFVLMAAFWCLLLVLIDKSSKKQ